MEPSNQSQPAPTRRRKLSKRERARRGGKAGGKATVPKGIATMTPERRKEISQLGVAARKAKKESE